MVMNRSTMQKSGVSLLLAIGALACNSVLGFGEATVDPALTATGDAATQSQALTCDSYCTTIMKNCTGAMAEYLNDEVCKAMCSHFELGRPGDAPEDSLGCRTYHALSAAEAPRDHCKHAGPTGAGHCGAVPCTAFCALNAALCTGTLQPYAGGELGCRRDCAKYTYLLGPDDQDLIEGGPTLNCRLWHLESAFDPNNPQAKVHHCPHTGLVSTTCF